MASHSFTSAHMAARCGVKNTTVIFVFIASLTMMIGVWGTPDVKNNEGECLVSQELLVTRAPEEALNVSLAAFVNRRSNLMLGFFFSDLSEKERDAVNITNIGATHVELRDGQGTEKSIDMSRLIPEGWNTFRVTEAGGNVMVMLVQGQDYYILFPLTGLRTTLSSIRADGIVTSCPEVTPTWEVGPNNEVEVDLQPVWNGGRNQWIEVSSREWGGANVSVTFPFAPSSYGSNRIFISENTTFRISGRVLGSHAHYKVFKIVETGGSGGEEGEEVVSGNITVNTHSHRLVVSGGGGGHDRSTNTPILVRLSLSSPQENITTSDYYTSFKVMLPVLVVVISLVVALIWGTYKNKGEYLPCYIKYKERRSIKSNKAVEQVDAGNLDYDCAYKLSAAEQVIDESSSSSYLLSNGRAILRDASEHCVPVHAA